MFEKALSAAESLATARSSKYDEVFTPEERAELGEFTKWLVVVHEFKPTSASSYRANFSRACVKLDSGETLNSDERSALRKFEEFSKRHANVVVDDVEDIDELDDDELDALTS